MKKQALVVRTIMILAITLCLAGCGGGSALTTPSPPSPPQSVPPPPPAITSLSPFATAAGGSAFTLTVNGTGFANGDSVFWQVGNLISERQTTFVSTTQILATIPASDIAAPGAVAVFVRRVNSQTRSNMVTFPIFAVAPVAQIERVSVAGDGAEANGGSYELSVSADGRYVAFTSSASNLVVGDTNGSDDIFLRDTCYGAPAGCAPTTIRVSVSSDGGNAFSISGLTLSNGPSLSSDGRYVTFASTASNLVSDDTNGLADIFLRDTCISAPAGCLPTTRRISVTGDGSQALRGDSFSPSISSNGRYVAFSSDADNLVAGDSNIAADVFLRDTCLGASVGCVPATIRVSVGDDGSQVAFHTLFGARFGPAVSGNGRFVAFTSASALLVAGDSNGFYDVLVRDTCLGAASGCLPSTSRVSLANDGSEARGGDSFDSAISSDGRFIAFNSRASNLVPASSGAQIEIFLHDTCVGAPAGCTPTTQRISAPLLQYTVGSLRPVISADGRFVLFLGGNGGSEDGVLAGFAFLHDACTGAPAGCLTTTLVLSESLVTLPPGFIHSPAISADGGAVGFASSLSSLVANDDNAAMDVFIVRLPRP